MSAEITVRITLPMPPSANRLFANIKGQGRVRAYAYRRRSDATGWLIRSGRDRPISGPARVEIRAGKPNRRRDLDNLAKPCLDMIVEFGVIPDDSNRVVREIVLAWDVAVEPENVVLSVRAADGR